MSKLQWIGIYADIWNNLRKPTFENLIWSWCNENITV